MIENNLPNEQEAQSELSESLKLCAKLHQTAQYELDKIEKLYGDAVTYSFAIIFLKERIGDLLENLEDFQLKLEHDKEMIDRLEKNMGSNDATKT